MFRGVSWLTAYAQTHSGALAQGANQDDHENGSWKGIGSVRLPDQDLENTHSGATAALRRTAEQVGFALYTEQFSSTTIR